LEDAVSRCLQHELSKRERQIMEAIYRRRAATALEVRTDIASAPSYSAVRTTLRILEGKGFLRHRKRGRQYLYLPTIPHTRARQSAIRQLVDTYFEGSLEATVAAMIRLDGRKLAAEEYRRLVSLIQDAEKWRTQ
jgi:BlaI family transcriptional regulator, penicillinase repressor